ncbi:uncharacterized protein [Centruroides vittatus]|uniref:uncharacterized protein n=2 Tax=Centruroides vittatus TaxID=120091 RepID=UPI00350FAC2F
MNTTGQDYIRWKARFSSANERKSNLEARRFHSCIEMSRQWLQMNDIVLIKADKSKGVVLTKRDSYNHKLHEYIRTTECQHAPNKYMESLQQRVKKFSLTPLARILRMHNSVLQAPKTPRIFAFGKTHKPGYQIRPVIEKCGSPTFAIEKQLVKFIRPKIQEYPYAIQNAVQLVEKLNNITLKDKEYMTVMDFKSLFPSIRLPPCFCELRDFLFANIDNATKYHSSILELANLICYTSFFEFEDETYLQERGVPMGSPMSSILCELVLRRLENKVIPFFQHQIILYARYVDDVFILWKNNSSALQFLQEINKNPYGLTLALDQESASNVNFLDLSITCKEGQIWTDVYRKPSYQPIIIPKNSFDPMNFKYAAFHAWIKRAHTHCTSVIDTYKELDYIRTTALQHGYRSKEIDGLIDKFRKAKNRQLPPMNQGRKVILNYFPFLHTMIKKVARNNNMKVLYRRNPTVYRLLRNDKKKENQSFKTGVYSIPLKDRRFNTDLVYVGATMRHLKQRLKEHRYSINKSLDSTVLAAFAKHQDVDVHWDKASIIRATTNKQMLKHLEKLEIYKAHVNTGCINHRDADALSTAWKSFYRNA